ncbi:MAG: magnesium/cobalt transporter CorA [Candidatus Krumholzibacteria bacterium]|nr:magnesium/cobalt transporter CorA [Candidatus Krumholzibacteria bacterium]
MIKRKGRIPLIHPDGMESPPGTLRVPDGALPSSVSVIAYSKEELVEKSNIGLADLDELRGKHTVLWINLEGLADIKLLQQLGERFDLHHLALESTLDIPQRPKIVDYDSHQFIVTRMPISHEMLQTEQVSIFFGPGFVITVQEQAGDCFDGIRSRIRKGNGRIRERGADYLAYAALDALIDAYFPLLELYGTKLDELELLILENQEKSQIAAIHDLKQGLITLHRYLGPMRELTTTFMRTEDTLITDQTRTYLGDCQDHAKQAFDLVESYRQAASGLMDLYLSMVSQRMNEVMKVLTIIATLFIPLSFVAGLYGMNFDPKASPWNMPELGWSLGYPVVLGLMLAMASGMLVYFWRKGWFR